MNPKIRLTIFAVITAPFFFVFLVEWAIDKDGLTSLGINFTPGLNWFTALILLLLASAALAGGAIVSWWVQRTLSGNLFALARKRLVASKRFSIVLGVLIGTPVFPWLWYVNFDPEWGWFIPYILVTPGMMILGYVIVASLVHSAFWCLDGLWGTEKDDFANVAAVAEIETEIHPSLPAPIPDVLATHTVNSSKRKSSRNYLIRHWRGEISLGVTYWVNGFLTVIVQSALVAVLAQMQGNYAPAEHTPEDIDPEMLELAKKMIGSDTLARSLRSASTANPQAVGDDFLDFANARLDAEDAVRIPAAPEAVSDDFLDEEMEERRLAKQLGVSAGLSLRAMAVASIGVVLFSIMAWLWLVVGTWRSADRHVERGGAFQWAGAAKGMVVLSILVLAFKLPTNVVPYVNELALIASGNDPIGDVEITVAANGRSVIVRGALREGSAAKIQTILDAAPGATMLVLDSNGGRIAEAQQLALVVRTRNLDTYVENLCVSACTFVFLAGKNRAATPNARIGFHQPSFPGMDADTQRSMTQDMMDVYSTAGLPKSFLQRIGKTSPEDMWYPTRDELIASNVITRVSLGGEAATVGLAIRSKQEFVLAVKSTSTGKTIEQYSPETLNEFVERGWAAKERGGSDADIMMAMRSVILELLPKLLKTSDVSTLDSYMRLAIDQMSAAQAISGVACTALLNDKLDSAKTLPKEIFEKTQEFVFVLLATPPRAPLMPPDTVQFQQAMQAAYVKLPQQYTTVVTNTAAYAKQPDLVCKSMIALFRAIVALPTQERYIVLRGLFQNNE